MSLTSIKEESLARIGREIHEMDFSEEELKILSELVSRSIEALDKSCEVGLEDIEPAIVYDPSE